MSPFSLKLILYSLTIHAYAHSIPNQNLDISGFRLNSNALPRMDWPIKCLRENVTSIIIWWKVLKIKMKIKSGSARDLSSTNQYLFSDLLRSMTKSPDPNGLTRISSHYLRSGLYTDGYNSKLCHTLKCGQTINARDNNFQEFWHNFTHFTWFTPYFFKLT